MAEGTTILSRERGAALERGAVAAGADHAASADACACVVERSPGLLRQVNELMREGRRGQTDRERIPFFCECERADCYEPVWVTSDMYDERRSEWRQPLVLPGHEFASGEAPWNQGAR